MEAAVLEAQSPEVELRGVAQTALTVTQQATTLVIVDVATRNRAAELGCTIASLLSQAQEKFETIKRPMNDAKAKVMKWEHEVCDPLEVAKRHLSTLVGRYDQEQERIRREEERRIQEQERQNAERQRLADLQKAQEDAQRQSEEQAIADAIELEAAGDKVGAEAVLKNPVPVEPVYVPPVYVPPVILPTATPKAAGMAKSTSWKWRVPIAAACQNIPQHEPTECETCLAEVPRKYLVLNTKLVGQVVRALNVKADIAGVEVYPDSGARFSKNQA